MENGDGTCLLSDFDPPVPESIAFRKVDEEWSDEVDRPGGSP